METRAFSRSMTLLLELVAAIVLFAAATAICIRVLLSARGLSLRAEAVNRGVEAVTSGAELLRAAPEEAPALEALAQSRFLDITRREEGGLTCYTIAYVYEDEVLYSLELVRSWEVSP